MGLSLFATRPPAHVPAAQEESSIELSPLDAVPAETTESTETTEPPAERREPASGVHPGTPGPPGGKDVPIGPLDARDGYGAIRAQIAGWDRRLLTGTYKPGGARIDHPDEMPSRRVPASLIGSVVRSNAGRFHVCHGAGLPGSAGVSGEVVVAFTIETDGRVANARDAGGAFPDDAVRGCIVRAVAQLSFQTPPLGLPQEVMVPIPLQAEEAMARPAIP